MADANNTGDKHLSTDDLLEGERAENDTPASPPLQQDNGTPAENANDPHAEPLAPDNPLKDSEIDRDEAYNDGEDIAAR